MDAFVHVVICMFSPYTKVHVGSFKCEKYSLKSEILDENSKFPTFYTTLLSFVLYSDDSNGHICTRFNVYVFPIYLAACGSLQMWKI